MSDLISREDALECFTGAYRMDDVIDAILALPAVQPDAREPALREAADLIDQRHRGDLPDHILSEEGNAIRALIDKPAHVNETPKSEHVPGDVLTPATKGGE